MASDTYPQPKHGWTCFHCGETFHTEKAARLHFGPRPYCKTACTMSAREVLHELRRTEKLLAQCTDGRMKAMGMEHKDPEQQVLDD